MIRYRCPKCRKALAAEDREAGAKLNCPHCSQRLQVPIPPPPSKTMLGTLDDEPNKTVLGKLEGEGAAAPPVYAGQAPPVPRTIVVPTEPLPADPPARSPEQPQEVDDDRPRVRRRSRRGDDDDDDDYDRPRRRRREGRPCPRCGCTDYPRQVTKFGGASIALLIIGIFFWPLILVAFFIQEKWEACPDCGEKLRQIGTGF